MGIIKVFTPQDGFWGLNNIINLRRLTQSLMHSNFLKNVLILFSKELQFTQKDLPTQNSRKCGDQCNVWGGKEKVYERMSENQLLFPKAGDRRAVSEMRALCFQLIPSEVRSAEERRCWGAGEDGAGPAHLPVSLFTVKTVSKPCLAFK